jgi:hypothetical protein
MPSSPLSLVLAGPDDHAALERLAALDSARPLAAPALIAYRDDQAVAAVSLADGRAVADPFVPAAHAIELLRLRARHLSAARPAGRSVRRWRRPATV